MMMIIIIILMMIIIIINIEISAIMTSIIFIYYDNNHEKIGKCPSLRVHRRYIKIRIISLYNR